MARKFLTVFFLLLFAGPFLSRGQKINVGFGKLGGYATRTEKEPKSGLNTQLFARKSQFDEYFMAEKGKKPSKTDFNNYVVLACMSAKTNVETTITLEKILKYNGVMEVFFRVRYGKKLAKPYAPLGLFSTAVDKSLSGMVFYVNDQVFMDLRN